MPRGSETYNNLFRGVNEQRLCQNKYAVDLVTGTLPEEAIVVDRIDLTRMHYLDIYIKTVEALLSRFCSLKDEDTIAVFNRLIVNSSIADFDHFFNFDKKTAGFLQPLENQGKTKNLIYLINTNYIYRWAVEMRNIHRINMRLPEPSDLNNFRAKNSISAERVLCDDLSNQPSLRLEEQLKQSRDKFAIGNGLNHLMNNYSSASNGITFVPEFSDTVINFSNKLKIRATGYEPAIENGGVLSPFDPDSGSVKCGNYIIDEHLGGLKKDGIHILASVSGLGKTQEMCLLALEAILKTNKKVILVTPESDASEIYSRIYTYLILGYNFEYLNKGIYSDKTRALLKELIAGNALFKYIEERLFLIDQRAIPKTGSANIMDKKALFRKIAVTQKEQNIDIIFVDSYYAFSNEMERFELTGELLHLAQTLVTPIVLSTQLRNTLGSKPYYDKDVTTIDPKQLSGGDRALFLASWCYGVFKVKDENTLRYSKKYIINKRRQSVHTEPVVFTNALASRGDYSCVDASPDNNMMYRTNLSYLFEMSLKKQGTEDLYTEVKDSMERDKNNHKNKVVSFEVLDIIPDVWDNKDVQSVGLSHDYPTYSQSSVEDNVSMREPSVIPEYHTDDSSTEDFFYKQQLEIVYTEDDFYEMLCQKLEESKHLSDTDEIDFSEEELVFRNSGNGDIYDNENGKICVFLVKHYVQNKRFMFPHEIEAFWNRLAKEEEVEVVSSSHAETGWVSDSNREKHWTCDYKKQFVPDDAFMQHRDFKNSGVSYITQKKHKRDYSIPFTDIAKSPPLHIGDVDVELSMQVDSIKRMQQEAMKHKQFDETDLTIKEKNEIITEAGLREASSPEELAKHYQNTFLEKYQE
jgi:hypothetical protein